MRSVQRVVGTAGRLVWRAAVDWVGRDPVTAVAWEPTWEPLQHLRPLLKADARKLIDEKEEAERRAAGKTRAAPAVQEVRNVRPVEDGSAVTSEEDFARRQALWPASLRGPPEVERVIDRENAERRVKRACYDVVEELIGRLEQEEPSFVWRNWTNE